MKNLYETFGCTSKEELYEMVKGNDTSVKALNDFIMYTRSTDLLAKTPPIRSPRDAGDYYTNMDPLEDEQALVMFLNTKNQPIHMVKFNPEYTKEMQQALREGIVAGANSAMLFIDNNLHEWDKERARGMIEQANFDVLDTFLVDMNYLTSTRGNETFQLNSHSNMQMESTTFYGNLYELDGFTEFAPYYINAEAQGLNILNDNKELQELLKFGYQHHKREVLGVIMYDEHEQIIDVQEMFKGGTNSAVVDSKVIAREMLIKGAHGIAVFHNHPSGHTQPSPEDIAVTENLQQVCQLFDKELLDHYIVGKEGVYSLAATHQFECKHEDYKALMEQQQFKNKMKQFEQEIR